MHNSQDQRKHSAGIELDVPPAFRSGKEQVGEHLLYVHLLYLSFNMV